MSRVLSRAFFLGITAQLLIIAPARAATDSERPLYLGAGFITQNIERTSTSETGATGLIANVMPHLHVSSRLGLGNSWSLAPSAFATPFGRKSPEGGMTTRLFGASLRASRSFEQQFDFSVGPGLFWTYMSGSGGTSTQSNGNSTTEFGLPAYSETSRVLTLELGMGIRISPIVRLQLDLLTADLLSSRRALNLLAAMGVGVF